MQGCFHTIPIHRFLVKLFVYPDLPGQAQHLGTKNIIQLQNQIFIHHHHLYI